jgi:phospholipid/cholesterol/gamma-HCH transport system substrate-binding protein
LRGDAAAEIPKLVIQARDLLDNLNNLTKDDAALQQALANLQVATERLKGPQGAMGLLMGNDEDAKQLAAMLGNANAVLARADGLIQRLDSLVVNADRQVFGQDPGGSGNATGGGLVGDARTTVQQLNGLLGEARGSLTKLDTLLVEAQGIASNTREATTDLGALRSDVDSSLRKVDALINDLNRKWPFARDTEIKLP